jgi:hypothetical protein
MSWDCLIMLTSLQLLLYLSLKFIVPPQKRLKCSLCPFLWYALATLKSFLSVAFTTTCVFIGLLERVAGPDTRDP